MAESFFKALKRRKVFKVGIAYLVMAWAVIQVVQAAVPALRLPAWVDSLVFLLAVIGFPVALFFAWAYEITPEGIKRDNGTSLEDPPSILTGRKLDFIIISLLTVALGYFIYESRFKSIPAHTGDMEAKPPIEIATSPQGTSIAVLAFSDMSQDKDQEHLSDGISEEILNLLAKVPRLKVTSRSSAFYYKNAKFNVPEVAEKLGVKNILEGSVRKSGNRIRITAQLVEATTDTHLWSDSYDRELTDIFAIQDEIASAIVDALKSELGLDAKIVNRDRRKINVEAHSEYLKGRSYIENRNKTDLEKALVHFNKAIELAPNHAQAWMGKGWASLFLGEKDYGTTPNELALQNARIALDKALELDPELPETHGILGMVESDSFNPHKAIYHYKKAIALNPNYADAYVWYGKELFRTHPKSALTQYQKAVSLSPMSILANYNYANQLVYFGRLTEARAIVDHMLSINSAHQLPYQVLGAIQLAEGRYAESALTFEKQIKHAPDNVNARFNAAGSLAAIGLSQKGANLLQGKRVEPWKHWYNGNNQQYVGQIRSTFPRTSNDLIGYTIRAHAEAVAEDYATTVQFLNMTEQGQTSVIRIYSYQRVGLFKEAQDLLASARIELNGWIKADIKFRFDDDIAPIELREMELAYLDGDIEKAIAYLKKAMTTNYIVDFNYKNNPIYQHLKEHPDWASIMRDSDKRAAEQRAIYYKLSTEAEANTL